MEVKTKETMIREVYMIARFPGVTFRKQDLTGIELTARQHDGERWSLSTKLRTQKLKSNGQVDDRCRASWSYHPRDGVDTTFGWLLALQQGNNELADLMKASAKMSFEFHRREASVTGVTPKLTEAEVINSAAAEMGSLVHEIMELIPELFNKAGE